jgi:outer membrane immunogenic protein
MNGLSTGLFAIAALAAVWSPAAVAGQQSKPSPNFDWAGPYVGIEGGGAWGSARQTDPGFDSGGYNVRGGLVGGTLGYNWQLPPGAVLGLEGDISWASIKGSTTGVAGQTGGCGGLPFHCEADLQALGTLRANVGVPVRQMGNLLPYLTGGLAVGSLHGKEGDVLANGAVGSGSVIRVGWTAGAGLAAKLNKRWTAKLEYLFVDLGKGGVFTDTLPSPPPQRESIRFSTNIVRLGLDYKFN